jgi:hypothetical protein
VIVEDRQVLETEAHMDRRDADDRPSKARDASGAPRDSHAVSEVRQSDIEPYTGLRYLSKLFRFMAVILVLLLIAEVITGVYTQGSASIPTLLGEATRLIVLAGVLWGTGDFAHLLIDAGHDVRASRIMIARATRASHSIGFGSIGRDRPPERAATSSSVIADRSIADRSPSDEGDHGPPIP